MGDAVSTDDSAVVDRWMQNDEERHATATIK